MKNLDELRTTQQELNEVSKSFCLAKWKNATLHLHNGNSQSCHHVKSHRASLDPANPSSLHNTPEKMQARAQMLQGQRPAECQYCWKVEDKGDFSDRIHKSSEPTYKDFWQEVIDSGKGPRINPSFLEVSFDHKCQLRCMYCSPAYSSQWEKEIQMHGAYPITSALFQSDYNKPLEKTERNKYIAAFWQWWPEVKQSLRYLRITGGEPLLAKETTRLMQEILQNPCPDLNFALNTNLAFDPPHIVDLTDRLNQMQSAVKSLSLFVSLDCAGPQAEYIRYGLNETQFFLNVDSLLENISPPFTLCFVITVNNLSLPGLGPLLKRIADYRRKFPMHRINLDTPYLKNPRHLSVEILTPNFRHYVDESLQVMREDGVFTESEMQKISRIRPLIANSSLPSAMRFWLRKDFLRFIVEYDKRKGLSFSQTFPEYQDFWQLCQSTGDNLKQSFSRHQPF